MRLGRISVAICCYTLNRLKDIRESIHSLLNQTLTPFEIIICVDNNDRLYSTIKELVFELTSSLQSEQSVSGTENGRGKAEPENPRIVAVHNTVTPGLSETRNVSIRSAEGDIVAFIDDDALATPTWLASLTAPLLNAPRNPGIKGKFFGVVGVAGRAEPLWVTGSKPAWFPEELYWLIGCTYAGLPLNQPSGGSGAGTRARRYITPTVRNVHGCNMAFLKEVVQEAGYFRADLGPIGQGKKGAEEADLCLRIKSQFRDAHIVYQPEAVIFHKVPRWRLGINYLLARSFDEGFSKSRLAAIHGEGRLQPGNETLRTEVSYLTHLVTRTIPRRLRGIHKDSNLGQLVLIFLSMISAAAGYGYANILEFLRAKTRANRHTSQSVS